MIEEWINFKNLKDPRDYDIKVDIGTSYESLEVAINCSKVLGKIKKVVHYRKKHQIEYYTIITGEHYEMAVIGGLTSGYDGSGSNALVKLLVELGFDQEHVESLIFTNPYDNAVITFEK